MSVQSPNPPESPEPDEVGAKTMQGASLMVLRTLVLYPVGFAGEVLLARLLAPEDFGVYALASFVTVTLAGVLEVGLAASLIQRHDEPRDEEYQTLFTLQVLGITALALIIFFSAPLFFPWLGFDVNIRWMLLALLLCPWISSFGTMSCVKLERELRYAVFARMDVLRGLTYVGSAVALALAGARAWSFAVAIVLSTLVKTCIAFRQAPWPVRFRLRLAGMGQALRFGVMFQLSTLTSLFRDHIGVVLGGPLFGVQSVGYLNWAKNTTYYTSQIFTQVVSRVAFPSISRVQHDAAAIRQMTQTLLKYVNLFTFPVIGLFAALIPEFVTVFYTDKWLPAIPAFYFYSLRMIGSNITTLYISVLNALGRVRVALRILIWWTVADWTLALALCPPFGFTGIAMAYGLSVIPISVWLVVELNRVARLDLWRSLFQPLCFSMAAAALIWVVKVRFTPSWISLALLAAAGLAAFLLPLLLLEGKVLWNDGRMFLESVLKGRGSSSTAQRLGE
ncbi:MAG: oligosaccharide flippase family protein [Acidobacteria bacterium]|nr:oligosaccharide flippase family protein [Acidobacteriota bacterium]